MFKIFYADVPPYLGNDAQDCPGWGVICIVQPNDVVGREVIAKKDYYVRYSGRWIGVDLIGMIDLLVLMGIVKVGRSVPNQQYQEVIHQALHDDSFPDKSGRLPGENY